MAYSRGCDNSDHKKTAALPSILQSRAIASADLELPDGLGFKFGLGIGPCWPGPTCKIEVHHKRPIGRLLPFPSPFGGSMPLSGLIPKVRHDTAGGVVHNVPG